VEVPVAGSLAQRSLRIKSSSENHSGHADQHSGLAAFLIDKSPES
jgi:hypothetical protein